MRYRTGFRAIDCRRLVFTGWVQTRIARVSGSMGLLRHDFYTGTVSNAPASFSGAQQTTLNGSLLLSRCVSPRRQRQKNTSLHPHLRPKSPVETRETRWRLLREFISETGTRSCDMRHPQDDLLIIYALILLAQEHEGTKKEE